jgi:DNA polymerase-3 subunit epsilon
MKELSHKWSDLVWIGFDTETTGKYPLESEICEIAATAWKNGEIIGEFQSLVKPSKPMGQEVIRIHNITNEMVATAPSISEVLPRFLEFASQGVLIAHHAPFDMGFVAVEIEKHSLEYPLLPVVCSSRLARKMIPESFNHKLQTLVQKLNIDPGQAHRALDDARSCLLVGVECFRRIGAEARFGEILTAQAGPLDWVKYSIRELEGKENYQRLIKAVRERSEVLLTYEGGSRPGKPRGVFPQGIVRNPDGDFLVASEIPGGKQKRYLLEKISKVG